MNTPYASAHQFDTPCVYRIKVAGRIGERWLERMHGMEVSVDTADAGAGTTSLVGEMTDQAALVGVLTTLYELHLSVISVERLQLL
jgi:hypothetical protein